MSMTKMQREQRWGTTRHNMRSLDLPPPFRLLVLREAGDAFAHACAHAPRLGAGMLVFVGRFDVAEFAVVLEPEEELGGARRSFYAGMSAIADALSALAPPETPIAIEWPDRLEVGRGFVGGGRLGWPELADEHARPDWLVFGAVIRLVSLTMAVDGVGETTQSPPSSSTRRRPGSSLPRHEPSEEFSNASPLLDDPGATEALVPAFAGTTRGAIAHKSPGLMHSKYRLPTSLADEGFGEATAERLVEGFARHLMVVIDRWQEGGFAAIAPGYLSHLRPERGVRQAIDASGNLRIEGGRPAKSLDLRAALAMPSWLERFCGDGR